MDKIKKDFLDVLKKELIHFEKQQCVNSCGYYHTFVQNIDSDHLTDFFLDLDRYDYSFQYCADESGGYTEGYFNLFLHSNKMGEPNHFYRLTLDFDDRLWGYCSCTPDDDGYNEVKDCCGNGCDWSAPSITIAKEEHILRVAFDGVERDLWNLQHQWSDEPKKARIKELKEKMKQLNDSITNLESSKERIESELKSLLS